MKLGKNIEYPSSITLKLGGRGLTGIHIGKPSNVFYGKSFTKERPIDELIKGNEESYESFVNIAPELAKSALYYAIKLRMINIMKKHCK